MLLLCLTSATPLVLAGTAVDVEVVRVSADAAVAAARAKKSRFDSKQMEKELQRLPWKQFKSVIASIPKMKASIDAYGPIGWQFVQANYTTYPWQKNIDKLDEIQKKRLAELIQTAKRAR